MSRDIEFPVELVLMPQSRWTVGLLGGIGMAAACVCGALLLFLCVNHDFGNALTVAVMFLGTGIASSYAIYKALHPPQDVLALRALVHEDRIEWREGETVTKTLFWDSILDQIRLEKTEYTARPGLGFESHSATLFWMKYNVVIDRCECWQRIQMADLDLNRKDFTRFKNPKWVKHAMLVSIIRRRPDLAIDPDLYRYFHTQETTLAFDEGSMRRATGKTILIAMAALPVPIVLGAMTAEGILPLWVFMDYLGLGMTVFLGWLLGWIWRNRSAKTPLSLDDDPSLWALPKKAEAQKPSDDPAEPRQP